MKVNNVFFKLEGDKRLDSMRDDILLIKEKLEYVDTVAQLSRREDAPDIAEGISEVRKRTKTMYRALDDVYTEWRKLSVAQKQLDRSVIEWDKNNLNKA